MRKLMLTRFVTLDGIVRSPGGLTIVLRTLVAHDSH